MANIPEFKYAPMFHLKNGMAFKLANANVVLSKEVILRSVLSKLEHRSVLEFRNVCHKKL